MSRRGDWIQTRSGGKFYPLDPRPEEINIWDIAHALSNQCRFVGHTSEFYSVAQHSVLVSEACDPFDALWGLLHDGSEAYLSDVARPVKIDAALKAYRDAEDELQFAVCLRFGLDPEMPASVKRADEILLATESRDLMSPRHPEWERWIKDVPTLGTTINPWSPARARAAFLARFSMLAG